MTEIVGMRDLRRNLTRYLDRVRAGEELVVTVRGCRVARLIPYASEGYVELARTFGATVPAGRLEQVAAHLRPAGAPSGTTDAYLAETRR